MYLYNYNVALHQKYHFAGIIKCKILDPGCRRWTS